MKKLLILILLVVISLSVKSQEINPDKIINITVFDLNDESIHKIAMYKNRNEYLFAIDSVVFIYSNQSINKSYKSFEIQEFKIKEFLIYDDERKIAEKKNTSRVKLEYIRDINSNILSFLFRLDEEIYMWEIINAK